MDSEAEIDGSETVSEMPVPAGLVCSAPPQPSSQPITAPAPILQEPGPAIIPSNAQSNGTQNPMPTTLAQLFECWVEARTVPEQGARPYYYHARTRETRWERPASESASGPVTVLTQSEYDSLHASLAAQQPPMQMQVPASAPILRPPAVAPPHLMPPPFGMMGRPPLPLPPGTFPPPMSAHMPYPHLPLPGIRLPLGVPPLQPQYGTLPPMLPPFPMQLPPGLPMPGLPLPPNMLRLPPPVPLEPEKPPEVAEWKEYRTPDGRAYYHNERLAQTTWEKPRVWLDWEERSMAARAPTMSHGASPAASGNMPANVIPITTNPALLNDIQLPSKSVIDEAKPPIKTEPPTLTEPGAQSPSSTPLSPPKLESKQETVTATNDLDQKPTAPAPVPVPSSIEPGSSNATANSVPPTTAPTSLESAVTKSKPVASCAVPGTPWCLVWTGESKAFFFNPSIRLSVWDRPLDLVGRSDVDIMLTNPPHLAKDAGSKPSGPVPLAPAAPLTEKAPEAPIPITQSQGTGAGSSTQKPSAPSVQSGRTAALLAEAEMARQRAQLPLEDRVQQFKQMLTEKCVSVFSTFEKELSKIVFDQRYLLLSSKERKSTFEDYCRERIQTEKSEKLAQFDKFRDAFRALLIEAKITPRSSYNEFATSRYSRDDRYRAVDRSREREQLFYDYVDELREKERERERELERARGRALRSRSPRSRSRPRSNSRSKSPDWSKSRDRDRDLARGRDKGPRDRDRGRMHSPSRERDRDRDRNRPKDGWRSRDRSRDRDRDLERDLPKRKRTPSESDADSDKDRDRSKVRVADSESASDGEPDAKRAKDEKDKDSQRNKKGRKHKSKDHKSKKEHSEKGRKEFRKQLKTLRSSGQLNLNSTWDEVRLLLHLENEPDEEDQSQLDSQLGQVRRPASDWEQRSGANLDASGASAATSEPASDGKSPSKAQAWFEEFLARIRTDEEAAARAREREREERAEAAIRERAKQVAESRGEALAERAKEQAHHAHDEAAAMFDALLLDLIKTPAALLRALESMNAGANGAAGEKGKRHSKRRSTLPAFRQARRVLVADARYELCERELGSEELESLYEKHLRELRRRQREAFFRLLTEMTTSQPLEPGSESARKSQARVSPSSTWKEAKRVLREDARVEKLALSKSQMKDDFLEWQSEHKSTAPPESPKRSENSD